MNGWKDTIPNVGPFPFCSIEKHALVEDILRRLVESTECDCEDHAEARTLLGPRKKQAGAS